MKKKLQKYLSGNQEGFSLVELIIVIAIMAILIGVVALAVIPYLQRSRESKDLSTLDTVCSALSSAVATSQVTGSGTVTISDGDLSNAASTGDGAAVLSEMQTTLGSGSKKLTSKNVANGDIVCVFNAADNTIYVMGCKAGETDAGVLENTKTGYSAASTTAKPTQDADGKALVVAN